MVRKKTPTGDPVVAEVREIKERLAARHNYDAEAMLRDAMRRQNRQGRKVVTLAKRPVRDNQK
jgi:hypothetical protein